jgi:hypothetical protein
MYYHNVACRSSVVHAEAGIAQRQAALLPGRECCICLAVPGYQWSPWWLISHDNREVGRKPSPPSSLISDTPVCSLRPLPLALPVPVPVSVPVPGAWRLLLHGCGTAASRVPPTVPLHTGRHREGEQSGCSTRRDRWGICGNRLDSGKLIQRSHVPINQLPGVEFTIHS